MILSFEIKNEILGLSFVPFKTSGPFERMSLDGPFQLQVGSNIEANESTAAAIASIKMLRAEAVEAARKRMPKELAALAAARQTLEAADKEVQESSEAVAAAERAHRAALQAAKPPGPTRAALESAKTRASDAGEWRTAATNRHTAALHQARTKCAEAWLAETSLRQSRSNAAAAAASERICELLVEVARIALEVGPSLIAVCGDGTEELLEGT